MCSVYYCSYVRYNDNPVLNYKTDVFKIYKQMCSRYINRCVQDIYLEHICFIIQHWIVIEPITFIAILNRKTCSVTQRGGANRVMEKTLMCPVFQKVFSAIPRADAVRDQGSHTSPYFVHIPSITEDNHQFVKPGM